MFTGIVQARGVVVVRPGEVLELQLDADFAPDGFDVGESISVNGVCLTLLPGGSKTHKFDLSPETLHRSALGRLKAGDPVNLERAMSANGRFGGHVVQGHVDATGTPISTREEGNSRVMRFQCPPEFDRYLIDKGSICIDGVSLTVVTPENGIFDVWVIPHTIENTTLGNLAPGDPVNLEFDVIAKYVEKMMASAPRTQMSA